MFGPLEPVAVSRTVLAPDRSVTTTLDSRHVEKDPVGPNGTAEATTWPLTVSWSGRLELPPWA
jgi:hypothetical protein